MKEKISSIIKTIFSVTLAVLLIATIFVLIAFLAALIIGGSFAASITGFISAYVMPTIYKFGTAAGFLGIIDLYMHKKYLYTMEVPKKDNKAN